jgi:carboxylate-amine ligase
MSVRGDFGFGLETEYILVDKAFRPLWIHDLDAAALIELIDSITNTDISTQGFNIKPLHKRAGHYLLEGYTLTDSQFNALNMLPKGIEIRTPVASSYQQCIDDTTALRRRLDARLAGEGLTTTILSHHPLYKDFNAPQNYARHDYWQWALTATSTYGPDCNISVPSAILKRIDRKKLHARINYYMPALIALTLDSPLAEGNLWTIDGRIGKSLRTFRRRMFAPLYYVHNREGTWFEFKGFEMARNSDDYLGYFLLCLTMLLGKELEGTANDEQRLEQLGQIAVSGIECDTIQERAKTVLEQASSVARKYNFNDNGLDRFWQRLETTTVPADEVSAAFTKFGTVEKTLQALHHKSRPAEIVTVHPTLSLQCS